MVTQVSDYDRLYNRIEQELEYLAEKLYFDYDDTICNIWKAYCEENDIEYNEISLNRDEGYHDNNYLEYIDTDDLIEWLIQTKNYNWLDFYWD